MKVTALINGAQGSRDSSLDRYNLRLDRVIDTQFGPRTESMYGTTRMLGGCGVGGLWHFSMYNPFATFADKAEFLSAVYRELRPAGNVLYCISDSQLRNDGHLALLEIGAKEIAVFPNLCHEPSMMHLFLVNVHEAVNRFCDVEGTPYTEPREYVPYVFKPTRNLTERLERKA